MDQISAFCSQRALKGITYLGDGAYCAHDHLLQVWLMTERNGRIESIALDIHAWDELVRYRRALFASGKPEHAV